MNLTKEKFDLNGLLINIYSNVQETAEVEALSAATASTSSTSDKSGNSGGSGKVR